MKKIVKTDKAPAAIGPYSQGVFVNSMLFVSGQVPLNPENGELEASTISEQTRQSLSNLQAVVEEAGLTLHNVVKCTVFLKDMNDFTEMNKVYADFFTENPPARAAVEVARLPKDVLVEIECIATK